MKSKDKHHDDKACQKEVREWGDDKVLLEMERNKKDKEIWFYVYENCPERTNCAYN